MSVLSISRSLDREGKEISSSTDGMASECVEFTRVFATVQRPIVGIAYVLQLSSGHFEIVPIVGGGGVE